METNTEVKQFTVTAAKKSLQITQLAWVMDVS